MLNEQEETGKFGQVISGLLQRKIEEKVREKIKSSNISNSKKIIISAQLFSEELNLDEKIEGEIEIEI